MTVIEMNETLDAYLLSVITNDYDNQIKYFGMLKHAGASFNDILLEIRDITKIIHTDHESSKPFNTKSNP